jgi:pimeloyl-ACP methyl ester carboxylesterase/DNA-binding CsgD family transcriptional regulator
LSTTPHPIRYCKAANGMSIAWATVGTGPPLVFCSMIHDIERAFSYDDSQWTMWLAIARGRRLVVYDGLGSGLSDRSFDEFSIENSVSDMACVVDAAGLERFSLCANALGAQPAIVYAARHPERVERLVIVCGMARGLLHRNPSGAELAQREATLAAMDVGGDDPLPAFRLLNAISSHPHATHPEQLQVAEFFRRAVSARAYVRFIRAQMEADVSEYARRVQCPTLIAHTRECARIPFDEGRRLASLIQDARFLPLDGTSIAPTPSEPAYRAFVAAAREFIRETSGETADGQFGADLTPRERDVLELLAQGLDNLQIAAHLNLSEKTIRNNITPIFDKLQVENRAQAIVKAREAGFGKAGQSDSA